MPRNYLSEWVKPLFPKYRHSLYGLEPQDLEICREQSAADAFILPMTWNYYFERGKIQDALKLIKEYKRWDKPIYTWADGDYTYKVPKGYFILFRHNGYQSIRRKHERAYPVIIRAPLEYMGLPRIKILPKVQKPKIGFCGLADRNWFDSSLRAGRSSMFKLVNLISKPYLNLSHPISGTRLRRKVLNLLSKSKEIQTNFHIRYSSGGQKINSRKYILEFWQNMLTSPYTLCVRGAGNYSARFYESLAMGRIPVLVNTDCILPLDNKINWKQHCVIINGRNVDNLAEILTDFHNNLSSNSFNELQKANRELWCSSLTFHGFFHIFSKVG